jgi:hypothetical protein
MSLLSWWALVVANWPGRNSDVSILAHAPPPVTYTIVCGIWHLTFPAAFCSFLSVRIVRDWRTASMLYVFGEVRVATLALLTLTTLSGRLSSGVVMTKFSGQAATFRSSPTVCADTPRFLSASTRILSGKPPRAM